MNLVDVEKTLQAQVETDKGTWGTSGVEVSFTNTDTSTLILADAPFVAIDIHVSTFEQKSLGAVGSRLYRRNGFLSATVYAPDKSGSREIKKLMDSVLTTFEGKTFSGIVFEGASSLPVGSVDGWFAAVITVSFFYNSENI